MVVFWVRLVNLLVTLLTWGMLIHVLMGWFLEPFHPARQFTSRLFEPLLNPIRQIMPDTGMLDFSPIIFILLVQFIGIILTSFV
jgi:YggT family protein